MTDLQIAILIIGLGAILAVLGHGLWTLRKQKAFNTKHKLKLSAKTKSSDEELGVGEVRTVGKNPIKQDLIEKGKQAQTPQSEVATKEVVPKSVPVEEQAPVVRETPELNKQEVNEQLELILDDMKEEPEFSLDEALLAEQLQEQQQDQHFDFEDAVNQQERDALFELEASQPTQNALSLESAVVKENIELAPEAETAEFEVELDPQEPVQQSIEPAQEHYQEQTSSEKQPQFLLLSVHAKLDKQLDGAKLLPLFLELGLKYGEMNIFHRYSDANADELVFSVADMINPGTFDLETMDEFATLGVSFFMDISAVNNTHARFNAMYKSARYLAEQMDAIILDDQRQTMTEESLANYRHAIDQAALAAAQ